MVERIGVVLAAGLGSRLRPSTDFCPKPLIPVAGIEPLYFALYSLEKMGVHKVIVNAHYLHQMVFSSLEKWRSDFPNLEIRVSNESSQLLGSGGALLKIIEENRGWIQDAALLVFNGDTIVNLDLTRILVNQESALAISTDQKYLEKYGPVWLDDHFNWSGIGRISPEEGLRPAHFLGVHQLSPQVIDAIPKFCGEIRNTDLFNGIYRPLVNHGFVFKGVEIAIREAQQDSWFDITNKEYLLEAQELILKNARRLGWSQILLKRYPGLRESQDGCWSLTAHEGDRVELSGTSLYVNLSSKANEESLITLKEGSCWIQERPLKSDERAQNFVLERAILLLKREVNNRPPELIQNNVFLA